MTGRDWPVVPYNLALLGAAPILCGYALWRLGGRDPRWSERFGWVPEFSPNGTGRPHIWLHGVSVGEVAAARPVLEAIGRRSQARTALSVTTPTGRVVADRMQGRAELIFYWPLDFLPSVAAALGRVQPQLCLLMETELWPNFIYLCRRWGVPVVVVNGRFSDRTLRRSRLFRGFYRWLVGQVTHFCMQSQLDAQRAVALGAAPERVTVTGNVKFDQPVTRLGPAQERALRSELGVREDAPLLVAGSTHPGEEPAVLEAYLTARARVPELQLLIAPRHPARAAEVEAAIRSAGLEPARRTQAPLRSGRVIILDTVGELEAVFGLATIAFVGGSLVRMGGHNLLQPVAHGKPTFFGPHVHNFREMAAVVRSAEVGFQVEGAGSLAAGILQFLLGRRDLEEQVARCQRLMAAHQGAADRCAQTALGYLRR